MNNLMNITPINIRFILILIGMVFLFSCGEKQEDATVETEKQTYTCPMHPQIVQFEPSTCPICHMDLVPFDRNNQDEFLTLGPEQIALANIQTMAVGDSGQLSAKSINGRLVINPDQTSIVSSRVAGRVDRLFIKETGVEVKKGQPLYMIYSETLSALQQEYLVSIDQANAFPQNEKFQEIKDATKKRLRLFDQTEQQINNLENTKKPSPLITYYAPVSGVIAELTISEGQYVSEGGDILKIEGYASVWVEADATTTEITGIKTGDRLPISIAGIRHNSKQMVVTFIGPEYQSGSRYITLRGEIANPDNQLKPGMQVVVQLPGSGSNEEILIPANAVIHEGGISHVWIESDEGIFEPRAVQTGGQDAGNVEIRSGIDAGEKVVIKGAYLLYSEYVLKKGELGMEK